VKHGEPPHQPVVLVVRLGLARALSVAGHPALLLPVVALGQAWRLGASEATMVRLALVLLVLVGALGMYVVRQMRASRWADPDASHPSERRSLNRFLLVLMPLGALVSLVVVRDARLATALALGSAMVGTAMVLRHRLKLSLHVAFSVLAALVWAPAVMTMLVGMLLAAGVAWSRLTLGRHTWPDVWAGAVAGGVAGGVYAAAQGVVWVV
jgi:hypothetical protein